MMVGALLPYERSLAAAGGRPGGLQLQALDGRCIRLDVPRYLAGCDAADLSVLDRCIAPVLDLGCGPGRIAGALTDRGLAALGVDIAPTAIQLARERGAAALVRDLFDRVPGEGRWPTALVLDGNIGIGGDVDRLLGRLGAILSADGRAIIETAPEVDRDERLAVRFSRDGVVSGPEFSWAVIGAQKLAVRAAPAGMTVLDQWSIQGRCFVELGREALSDVNRAWSA